jgi:nucleotide-binding universal stress UspA family protein
MKILAAVDGSPSSDAVLDAIVQRPWPAGAKLRIVTVVPTEPFVDSEAWDLPLEYVEEIERAGRMKGEMLLESARRRFAGRRNLTVSTKLLAGSPGREILDEAERWRSDLIMVGSHGYGAVRRFLLGSVSHTVVVHAPCSVEVVRGPAET